MSRSSRTVVPLPCQASAQTSNPGTALTQRPYAPPCKTGRWCEPTGSCGAAVCSATLARARAEHLFCLRVCGSCPRRPSRLRLILPSPLPKALRSNRGASRGRGPGVSFYFGLAKNNSSPLRPKLQLSFIPSSSQSGMEYGAASVADFPTCGYSTFQGQRVSRAERRLPPACQYYGLYQSHRFCSLSHRITCYQAMLSRSSTSHAVRPSPGVEAAQAPAALKQKRRRDLVVFGNS